MWESHRGSNAGTPHMATISGGTHEGASPVRNTVLLPVPAAAAAAVWTWACSMPLSSGAPACRETRGCAKGSDAMLGGEASASSLLPLYRSPGKSMQHCHAAC